MHYHQQLHELVLHQREKSIFTLVEAPCAALQGVVDSHTVLINQQPATTTVPYLILPDMSAHVLLHFYFKTKKIRLSLVGPRSYAIRLDRRFRYLTLIVRLKPGGLYSFIKRLSEDLTDVSVPLQELWPETVASMEEQFSEAAGKLDSQRCIQLMERLLLQHYKPQVNLHPAVLTYLSRASEQAGVAEQAKALDISERYLRKLSWQYLGLPPKLIARIERLSHSLKLLGKQEQLGWAGIAAEAGYFDQSHMIDDYQALLGSSPGQLLG